MQGRLVLILTASQSSCGWPGKALLPLCLQSGSLGKEEGRGLGMEPWQYDKCQKITLYNDNLDLKQSISLYFMALVVLQIYV